MKAEGKLEKFETKDHRVCTLRRLTKGDLDALVRFANTFAKEKRTNRDLGVVSFNRIVTREREKKWLAGIIRGVEKREVVSVAAVIDGKIVGHCDIHRRSLQEVRHAGVLGIAVLDGYRGVGRGDADEGSAARGQ